MWPKCVCKVIRYISLCGCSALLTVKYNVGIGGIIAVCVTAMAWGLSELMCER